MSLPASGTLEFEEWANVVSPADYLSMPNSAALALSTPGLTVDEPPHPIDTTTSGVTSPGAIADVDGVSGGKVSPADEDGGIELESFLVRSSTDRVHVIIGRG